MSDMLANDVRRTYERAFATMDGILEAFPVEKWLEPHGDEYYIPSRIAYHIAEFTDGAVAGGFQDPEFKNKLPFGDWHNATAQTLPAKDALVSYYNEAVGRAREELAKLDDDSVTAPLPKEMAFLGATRLGALLGILRELSAHTGEMNKMLIENGIDDVWK